MPRERLRAPGTGGTEAWIASWIARPHPTLVVTGFYWATCVRLAVQLERVERVEVWGEPRLRAAELEADHAIASAQLGHLPDGRARLRRPDLVLFPETALPVAIGVELSQA